MAEDKAGANAGAGAGDKSQGAGAGDANKSGADQAAAPATAAAAAAAVQGAGDSKGGVGDGKGAGPAANWGDNWRETYAAGADGKPDETKLGVLKRYDSPRAVLDALFAARQRIDAGEVRARLPDNPTAEQITAYRKDNGVPEKPEGYFEGLPQGLELDEEDRSAIAGSPYLKTIHDLNLTPKQAHALFQARQGLLDSLIEKRVEQDTHDRASLEDALRAEWGHDYRANVNNTEVLFKDTPELRDVFYSARTPDGKGLFNDPAVRKFMSSLARQINPFGTLTGADGTALDGATADGRMQAIEKLMGDRTSEYWKGPRAEKLQQEYRDLVDRKQLVASRAGNRAAA